MEKPAPATGSKSSGRHVEAGSARLTAQFPSGRHGQSAARFVAAHRVAGSCAVDRVQLFQRGRRTFGKARPDEKVEEGRLEGFDEGARRREECATFCAC